VRVAELTGLRGVQPSLSKSQRAEGLEGYARMILCLLQETDSDQVRLEYTSSPPPEPGTVGDRRRRVSRTKLGGIG
jgi:hypothetical protein